MYGLGIMGAQTLVNGDFGGEYTPDTGPGAGQQPASEGQASTGGAPFVDYTTGKTYVPVPVQSAGIIPGVSNTTLGIAAAVLGVMLLGRRGR